MHYLGIDVAKAKLECSLLIDVDQHTRKSTSVAHSPAGIADVLTWISPHTLHPAQRHAVMEAPGVYHERAAATVHDAGVTVSIATPAQVKHVARGVAVRTNTDGVDSLKGGYSIAKI